MRFHLDENVDYAVAVGLKKHGIDVTTSHDAELLAATDEDQLHFAHSQQRVLVTHDADFFSIHEQALHHSGIAYCDHQRRSVGEIVRTLVHLARTSTASDVAGRMLYL